MEVENQANELNAGSNPSPGFEKGKGLVDNIEATTTSRGMDAPIHPEEHAGADGRKLSLLNNKDTKEEEYAFEEDEEAVQMQPRWLAIARYYSGKPYSTWGLFNELSARWGK